MVAFFDSRSISFSRACRYARIHWHAFRTGSSPAEYWTRAMTTCPCSVWARTVQKVRTASGTTVGAESRWPAGSRTDGLVDARGTAEISGTLKTVMILVVACLAWSACYWMSATSSIRRTVCVWTTTFPCWMTDRNDRTSLACGSLHAFSCDGRGSRTECTPVTTQRIRLTLEQTTAIVQIKKIYTRRSRLDYIFFILFYQRQSIGRWLRQ